MKKTPWGFKSPSALCTAPDGADAQLGAEGVDELAQCLAQLFVAMTRARDPLFVAPSSSPIVDPQRAENVLEWLV